MEEAPTFGKCKMRAQGNNAMGLEEHKMTCEVEAIPITDFYDFIKHSKKSWTELFLLKNPNILQASVHPHVRLSNVLVMYHYQNRIKIYFNKSCTKSKHNSFYRHVSPQICSFIQLRLPESLTDIYYTDLPNP